MSIFMTPLLGNSSDGSVVGGLIIIAAIIAFCCWIADQNKPKKIHVSGRSEHVIEKK